MNAMSTFPRYLALLVLFVALIPAGGCDRKAEPPGVVATVNGRPVTLGQLELHHDLRGMGLVATENPTVERLRQDYGRIMADLIIRELVFEELAKAGLAVTDEEISALEAEIRADYPPEVFDRMLFEENVDPAQWRSGLANRAALEKFVTRVLAPRLRVEVQEAADYYKEHVADFRKPALVTFLLVRGPDRKLVEQAVKQRDSGRTFPREPSPDAASIQEVRLPRDMLPAAWRDMLAKLKPGQAGPVIQERQEAMALVLVGEAPAYTLDPAAAYPQVEKILLEKKRNEAFFSWLGGALAAADIRISTHLLAGGVADSEAPSPDILEKEFPGVGDLAGGQAAHLADTGSVSKSLADRFPGQTADKAPPFAPDGETPPPGGPAGEPALPPGGASEPLRLVPGMDGGDDFPAPSPPAAPQTAAVAAPAVVPEASAPAKTPAEVAAPVPADPAASSAPAETPREEQPGETAPDVAAPGPEAAPASPSQVASGGPGEVEFLANKASWVIFTADDGREERVYIKGGKKHTVSFQKKLAVRLGSPSDVTYRFGQRQERVESSSREVKTLDFP
jgi:hypothetical protein